MEHQSRATRPALLKPGLLILPAIALFAAQPWSKDPNQWTLQDAHHILADSPWAQAANASFAVVEADEPLPPGPLPGAAQAGMNGSRGASDGNWDGGVGRLPSTGLPSIRVIIRWDSALPVRQALLRLQSAGEAGSPANTDEGAKYYIITIIGLVPSGQYKSAGQLETRSSSADTGNSGPQDPEQMLEGLMAQSRLMPRDRKPLRPEDVKLDAGTGTLHLFFPRSEVIELRNKEVVFATRFGSMTLQKQFHLKDMTYKGKLEL
jgi:hypothetical protein